MDDARSRVALLFAHDGALWGSTYTGGLFRIEAPSRGQSGGGSLQRFRTSDGLTSNQAVAILQDRENNIWAATENGLAQFRKVDIEQAKLPPRTSVHGYKMAVDARGTIYLASGETLYRARAGEEPVAVRPAQQPTATCADPTSGIWIAVAGRVEHVQDRELIRSTDVPGSQAITGCGVDRVDLL